MSDPTWAYSDDLRLVTVFLGGAMVLFGIGVLIVLAWGADGAAPGDVALGIGVFLLVFAVLLLAPRIRSRGARSFSLFVGLSMDEVQAAIRDVAREGGHSVQVEVVRSRARRPPRIVTLEGGSTRFLLRAAPYREGGRDAPAWTEVVAVGRDVDKDAGAGDLRDRIASRLGGMMSTAT